ncbi:hypothetical protein BIW11_10304 [Tropilaelaps mercedesae]|uniref:Protein SREK1IP1 n=1 Tax=Tropilaelaps mercedesae TaxID=418985 RepID=A0A1V9XGK5_9ACAR|nr:hypothetical protein BIW11_10304 [Tropilaelaps mercedesae]
MAPSFSLSRIGTNNTSSTHQVSVAGRKCANNFVERRRKVNDGDQHDRPVKPVPFMIAASVNRSQLAMEKPSVLSCSRCGYPGHFTYQCRNFLKANPQAADKTGGVCVDVSSTSSEGSDDDIGADLGRADPTSSSRTADLKASASARERFVRSLADRAATKAGHKKDKKHRKDKKHKKDVKKKKRHHKESRKSKKRKKAKDGDSD